MTLLIKADRKEISLEVSEEGEIKSSLNWVDANGLSKTLLQNIDKVLKESRISIKDLTNVKVEITEAGFSTRRIIETVAGTVDFCLKRV
jgi:RNA-binding protein YhbY